MWNCNNPYADRDENLKRLGFKSYQDYLHSDFWKAIRIRAIKRANNKCERCGSRGVIQVHHRAYDLATLAGSNIDSLSAVCRPCHCEAERPTDFTRTRYDRLIESSQAIAATPRGKKWELKCRRWYQRHAAALPRKASIDSQVLLVEKIRRRVREYDGRRCVGCGRNGCNPREPVKSVGSDVRLHFCGHHPWTFVRACVRALMLVGDGEQYQLAGQYLKSLDSTLTATDGDAVAASGLDIA